MVTKKVYRTRKTCRYFIDPKGGLSIRILGMCGRRSPIDFCSGVNCGWYQPEMTKETCW